MRSRIIMTVGAGLLAVGGALAVGPIANAGITPATSAPRASSTAAPAAAGSATSIVYQTPEECQAARREFVDQFRNVGSCAKAPDAPAAYTFAIQADSSGVVKSVFYGTFTACDTRRQEYINQFRTTTACQLAPDAPEAYTFTFR
jgi:hypothetical protein